MPRRPPGSKPRKRGPAPRRPTPEQQAKVEELRRRAHQAALLNAENHAFLLAVEHLGKAQEAIEKAMQARQGREVAASRPETKPSPEVLALEEAEQQEIRSVKARDVLEAACDSRVRDAMESWHADTLKYSEPVNRLVRSARCLLRTAEEILRREVKQSAESEDVPLPWEEESEILYRLVHDEAGLKKGSLVRAIDQRRIVDPQRVKRHFDALRHFVDRATKRTDGALWHPREQFMDGLTRAFGAVGSEDHATVDDEIRRAVVTAWATPVLHDQVKGLFPVRQMPKKRRKEKRAK